MELLKSNKILVAKEDDEKVKYKGAYVFPAIPGFHKWLKTLDYASLYPTTIRQHNISPEVYLGKILKFDRNEIDKDIIYCSSGATFDKNTPGVLPILLTSIYKDRKSAKHEAGDIESEIHELENILALKRA